MTTKFAGIEELYEGRDARAMSVEVDFGVNWHGEARWPTYRVTWIEDTGEMYLITLAGPVDGSHPIELLDGVQLDRGTVDAAFDGWAKASADHDSVQWARDRWARACA